MFQKSYQKLEFKKNFYALEKLGSKLLHLTRSGFLRPLSGDKKIQFQDVTPQTCLINYQEQIINLLR